ncbi:bacteriophage DNA transposition protein A%2C putative [Campylobacter hyointestinalis subsp. hyointestinalis]|uniref:DDE-type integrase/transposase/recombinase n=1 Tax=Campylobacter hyointestinalis TaxID=198 RepID=UPI00072B4C39|nr:DDE-type integrase/transposase/recombinase [Campylobacter hyointestinalis]CUU88614.1 bacteriophage DNA transposition protein A%2C putative [Campylobacter hyointestinalis subsp. hyointestinalis]
MWVDSKTAADVLGVKYDALVKSVKRAEKQGKKFCTIKPNILSFIYVKGIGRGGKILQIWLDKIPAKENSNEFLAGIWECDPNEAKENSNEFLAGIWECDPNEAKENSNEAEIWSNKTLATKDTKGDSNESFSDTRTNRAFTEQGLQGGSLCRAWQGEYKSSKDWQEDTTKETSLEPKSHKGSVNDEKYSKTSYETQEEPMHKAVTNKSVTSCHAKAPQVGYPDKSSQNRTIADIGLPCVVGTSVFANFSGGLATTLKVHKEKESDEKNKANLEEIRNPHISSGKYNNADDSVDEFQSYAITKEQEASHSLEELFDDMNIKDDKKADAYLKAKVVKLWLKARDKKVKIDAFLQYININNMYGKRVSKGQIYDWARRYANGGIKGLVDERGGNRPLLVELLGHKEKVDELILSSQGKINSYNVYNRLHHYFVSLGLLSHDEFIGKQKCIVAYDSINRYVNRWKKENPTTVLYIEKGYDTAVNSKLAGVGKADWRADFANEYVEIDATTLDLFAKKIRLDLASAIWKINKEAFRDFEECCERVKENQKRYTVVGLIDVHSGVCSYVIGKSENIYTVKRCLAKYIAKFGKPLRVVGDNGKAFKSNEMAGTFESLDIEYLAVRAYSGWLKPYIERSWRSFQDNFSQNIAGFIGHSVEQRQAIEFGFSKMERRLKKGEQTNLKRMLLINDLEKLMDDYIDEFINRRWLDRLGSSPLEAYKSDEDKIERLSSTLVCARLGNMLTKKVYKKGIMHDNAYYICAKSFEYDEVKIVPNINNVDEIYIWSTIGEFIGVGTRLNNGEGVSAEIAKEARAYTKKKIDKVRKAANAAAAINQDSFIEHVEYVKNARALEVGSAALEYEDELGALVKTEQKRAKSLRVINELLVPTKPKKQVEISWEGMVKKK